MSKARFSSGRILLACALLLSSSAVNLLLAQQKEPCHLDVGDCERDKPVRSKQAPTLPINKERPDRGGKQGKRSGATGESRQVRAAIELGNEYSDKKDYAQARSQYQRALGLKPSTMNRAVAYYNLGRTYYAQGLYAQAISNFRESIKLNPDLPEPKFLMADIYYDQRIYAKAIDLYKQVLRLTTNKPMLAVANFYIASSYYAQQLDTEAVEYFHQAIFYYPNDAEARFYLGNTYLALKRYPEAIEQYQRVISLKPEKNNSLSSTHTNLARVYFAQGRYKEAADHLELAIQLHPENYDARFGLGIVYLRLGKKDQAMAQYRLLLKQKPDWAEKLLAVINTRK